jgi:hypothetical protein
MKHTHALDESSYFILCQAREKLKSWHDPVVNIYLRSEHNVVDATTRVLPPEQAQVDLG